MTDKLRKAIRAFHGTDRKFDKFDIKQAGTRGDSRYPFGFPSVHGLHFSERESVARSWGNARVPYLGVEYPEADPEELLRLSPGTLDDAKWKGLGRHEMFADQSPNEVRLPRFGYNLKDKHLDAITRDIIANYGEPPGHPASMALRDAEVSASYGRRDLAEGVPRASARTPLDQAAEDVRILAGLVQQPWHLTPGPRPTLYEVNLNIDPQRLMRGDAGPGYQPRPVLDALNLHGIPQSPHPKSPRTPSYLPPAPPNGGDVYEWVVDTHMKRGLSEGDARQAATTTFRDMGIQGMRANTSREVNPTLRTKRDDITLFSDEPVEIIRRYVRGGLVEDNGVQNMASGGVVGMADGGEVRLHAGQQSRREATGGVRGGLEDGHRKHGQPFDVMPNLRIDPTAAFRAPATPEEEAASVKRARGGGRTPALQGGPSHPMSPEAAALLGGAMKGLAGLIVPTTGEDLVQEGLLGAAMAAPLPLPAKVALSAAALAGLGSSEAEGAFIGEAGASRLRQLLPSLSHAKTLLQRGATNRQIHGDKHNPAGWFRGLDGAWRVEVPDDFAMLDTILSQGPSMAMRHGKDYYPVYLRDVFGSNELHAAHPNLGAVPVGFMPDGEATTSRILGNLQGAGGGGMAMHTARPGGNSTRLNGADPNGDPDEKMFIRAPELNPFHGPPTPWMPTAYRAYARKLLAHEGQHAIQYREPTFDLTAIDPNDPMYPFVPSEVEARLAELRLDLPPTTRRGLFPLDDLARDENVGDGMLNTHPLASNGTWDQAEREYLLSPNGFNPFKANGGPVGYADGGKVEGERGMFGLFPPTDPRALLDDVRRLMGPDGERYRDVLNFMPPHDLKKFRDDLAGLPEDGRRIRQHIEDVWRRAHRNADRRNEGLTRGWLEDRAFGGLDNAFEGGAPFRDDRVTHAPDDARGIGFDEDLAPPGYSGGGRVKQAQKVMGLIVGEHGLRNLDAVTGKPGWEGVRPRAGLGVPPPHGDREITRALHDESMPPEDQWAMGGTWIGPDGQLRHELLDAGRRDLGGFLKRQVEDWTAQFRPPGEPAIDLPPNPFQMPVSALYSQTNPLILEAYPSLQNLRLNVHVRPEGQLRTRAGELERGLGLDRTLYVGPHDPDLHIRPMVYPPVQRVAKEHAGEGKEGLHVAWDPTDVPRSESYLMRELQRAISMREEFSPFAGDPVIAMRRAGLTAEQRAQRFPEHELRGDDLLDPFIDVDGKRLPGGWAEGGVVAMAGGGVVPGYAEGGAVPGDIGGMSPGQPISHGISQPAPEQAGAVAASPENAGMLQAVAMRKLASGLG